MAKKSGGGTLLLVGLAGVAYLISSIPKEIWIFAVVAAAGYFIYRALQSPYQARDASKDIATHNILEPRSLTTVNPKSVRHSDESEPVSVVPSAAGGSTGFKLPFASKNLGPGKWIPPGTDVSVGSLSIPGGMVYVGSELPTPYGVNDPCLIDPTLPIASKGEYTERQFGYWPSYGEISPSARRAYLEWLAHGRKDPEADIGYVFLFFYGLERRAILDGAKDDAVRPDWGAIATELHRLLRIYGEKSTSFLRYASGLLDWVSLADHKLKLYEQPVPQITSTYELPIYIRLALGQAAVDGVAVPPHLALAWISHEPTVVLRTPARRCPEQFEALFKKMYAEAFGAGLVVAKNRTKLKWVYRPASAGFRGYTPPTLTFGETPDVSVLTAPIKKLQSVVDAVVKELEPFSRLVGKNPAAKTSLEVLLQLPATLWPQAQLQAFTQIKERMGEGMIAMPFDELHKIFGAQATLTKDKAMALSRALESMNIGIEPDLLGGAKLPKPGETVVLFPVPVGEPLSRNTAAYQAAVLTLQLAATVAGADGEFTAKELDFLKGQVESWTHLTPNHLRRLLAHLRLLEDVPVSLSLLKKKLEPLDAPAKDSIATFMSVVAQSDGVVTPAEVKMLEKVYKTLGIDSKKVFSDVHSAAAGGMSVPSRTKKQPDFKLDTARIAALQQDTEKVTALLASIFQEEPAPVVVPEPLVDVELASGAPGILQLDAQHSALARMLLSRPKWSRAELLDVAADLELMLDGALEHINEAAFDKCDMVLVEGDDPLEVNADILEKIEA